MIGNPAILTLLVIGLCANAARSQEIFFFRGHYNLASMEQKPSPAELNAFITKNRKDFPQYVDKASDVNWYTLDSLKTRLHFLDLDGDHLNDVIFEGRSGGEPTLTQVYLRRGDGYKKVFSDLQGVMHLEWQNGRLYKLYIQNWGCCADVNIINKVYQLTYDKSSDPKFTQVYQGCYVNMTVFPVDTLQSPIRFEVLNDRYNIRYAPVIDDTSEQEYSDANHPSPGNIIGQLSKGATGTAFAKKTDATGREWWFVEIDEEYYPPSLVFPDAAQNEYPTKVAGWISSRFVKTL
jgi:hypothetical protein